MKSRVLSTLASVAFFSAFSLALLCVVTVSSESRAQVPRSINYQGYLTGVGGSPINAPNLQMVLSLYTASTGSSPIHTEVQFVAVNNGIFNVVLGSTIPLTVPFDRPYWLGVRVGLTDAEMTQRQPLLASPYAIRAADADALTAGAIAAGDINLFGSLLKNGGLFVHNLGNSNTSVGVSALPITNSGSFNNAMGNGALASNSGGNANNAFGTDALGANITGSGNTAVGNQSLWRNVGGGFNVASGAQSLQNNVGGSGNTAVGFSALQANVSGLLNTATGQTALWKSTGSNNTGYGAQALDNNTSGGGNIAVGALAGTNLTTGSNNIAIGSAGVAGESGIIRLGDSSVHNTTFLAGKVGIGTTTVTKAKLEISGSAGTYSVGTYGALSTVGATGSNAAAASLTDASLYASGAIVGANFIAHSDERIKRSTGRSNGARDLATLAAIEIADYTHIDTLAKGNHKHKKAIAQQVEKVFPQAVSQTTDVVPDIYQKAEIKDGWIKLATNLKKGERVRLIGKTAHGVHDVLEVAAGRFRTDFKADADTVFVYGREVKDFRNVDYEAIAMLNVSATQELNRRVERQDAKIAQLEQALAMVTQLQLQAQMNAVAARPVVATDASNASTALR